MITLFLATETLGDGLKTTKGGFTMRTLVISDIHGCYKEFISMLSKVNFTKDDELIILGDQVDRGPQNMDVVLEIIYMKRAGYNIVTIKGNHEEMFLYGAKNYHTLEELKASPDYSVFLNNGTDLSLIEYYKLSDEYKEKVINELLSHKHHYIKGDFLFVHAGVMPDVKLGDQMIDDLLWVRDEFIGKPHNLPYTVIFGHTPTPYLNSNQEFKIFRGEDKIGIDCGCVFGGNLACLDVFNDIEYYIKNKE